MLMRFLQDTTYCPKTDVKMLTSIAMRQFPIATSVQERYVMVSA